MRTVFLTGFMGAGKTTIGAKLGELFHCRVLDMDQIIEAKIGHAISEHFQMYGEAAFRDLETETLREFDGQEGIITTGGGVIMRPENREIMKKKGIVIFLNCDFPTIWERLIGDETRPLIKNKNKEEVEALYKKRLPFYLEGATAAVDTSGKTAEEAAMSVAQCLKELTDGETNTVQ